jgi:hypothetical protein
MSAKPKDTRNLLERIDNQPGLREQIEHLVTIAEAAAGTPDALDDIEELVLQAGPKLQKCILQNWLNSKQQAIQEVSHRNPDWHQSGKKK